MALKGTFHDLSLIDLLQLLNFSRKTGQLEIRAADERIRIDFFNGEILSLPETEKVGAPPEVNGVRRFKARLLNLFLLPSETPFTFEITEIAHPAPAVTIKIPNLILEGCRKITDWETIEKRIPSLDTVFRPSPAFNKNPSAIGLSPEEIQVLSSVDGRKNIREIAGSLQMDQMHVASMLFNLLSVNLVEKQEYAGPLPQEAPISFETLPSPQKYFLEELSKFRAAAAGLSMQEIISAFAKFINGTVQYLPTLSASLDFDLQKALEEIALSNPMAALIEVAGNKINTSDLLHSIKHIITGKKEKEVEAEIVDIFYRLVYRYYLFLFSSLGEEEQELGITLLDMLHVTLKEAEGS